VNIMALMAKDEGSKRIPAPTGVHNAVCVDVVDKGLVQGQFGVKHKIVLVWEIDEEHPDFGERFQVNKMYTLSLNEKSTLCQDLESWRGKPFTDAEKKGFDVEKLIGAPCMLNVVHAAQNGVTYANVKSITPLPKSMARLAPSPTYVRVMDRGEKSWDVRTQPQAEAEAEAEAAGGFDFNADSQLPF
jgi:hypothetical protein